MQTSFTLAQLADSDIREANDILRKCVHCGFCTATCPTYLLLGDELDSPRGRIYLIKDMLEKDKAPSSKVVTHIDRCLSCLSCMTTCPSGVNYMHLVDHARRHIEDTFRRPIGDRLLRRLIATVLANPKLFRLAVRAAGAVQPIHGLLPARLKQLAAMAPRLPAARATGSANVFPSEGARKKRVALLAGCVQQVLAPAINDATVRLLTRQGCEVVVVEGSGCCGALSHHLGLASPALEAAKRNIAAWNREIEGAGLDAIVVNASGCGTMVKDYAFQFREDPAWADRAANVSRLTRDVSEFIDELGLSTPAPPSGLRVAYQSACSMQHGQGIHERPIRLLSDAGFEAVEVPEGHICCGSAGTYNMLQPALATELRERKVRNIERTRPQAVATGNIGCIIQIAAGTDIPILHTVELLDWATGGPRPEALASIGGGLAN